MTTPRSERPRPTKKTIRITVRLSDEEHQLLLEKAKAVGLPPSTFLRELGLGRRLRARRDHLDGMAVAQLSRVGNNLRQLSRVAAETGDAGAASALDDTYAGLQATIAPLLGGFTEGEP